jgi:hypothetical protein
MHLFEYDSYLHCDCAIFCFKKKTAAHDNPRMADEDLEMKMKMKMTLTLVAGVVIFAKNARSSVRAASLV